MKKYALRYSLWTANNYFVNVSAADAKVNRIFNSRRVKRKILLAQ